MGRSRVTTTYRREFSPERSVERPCMTSLIRSNFDYAAYRRQLEGGHDNAPFLWDDWEYEAPTPERVVGRETCAADSVPARSVERPSKRTTRRRHRGRTALETQAVAGSAHGRGRHEAGSQTPCRWNAEVDSPPEPRTALRPAAATYAAAENRKVAASAAPEGGSRSKSKALQPSHTRVKSARAPMHTREWVLMRAAPASARPGSAPPAAGKAYSARGRFISDNPFAQYGAADEEQETGHKQTFNVRADDEIYKSALRAKKRQQVHVKERLEAECREPFQARRHRALFNDDFDLAMNKETAKWTSEYNRNYRGWRREA